MPLRKATTSNARPGRKSKTRDGAALHLLAEGLPVTDFLSYKKYLQDLYAIAKEKNRSYSYLQLAQDLGLSRSNVIWLVVSGRRRLTRSTLEKIIKSLKLRGVQRRYLEGLVAYNNATRPDQRELFFQSLLEMKTQKLKQSTQQNTLEYFSEWYHPIIRELVGLKDFSDDPEWIQKKLIFGITPKQIKGSLNLLNNLGLITYDQEKARYYHTDGNVDSCSDLRRSSTPKVGSFAGGNRGRVGIFAFSQRAFFANNADHWSDDVFAWHWRRNGEGFRSVGALDFDKT